MIQAHSPWLKKGENHIVLYIVIVKIACQFETMNSVDEVKFNTACPLCRSPLAPHLRSGYRERDRDLREKDRSISRDRDEHYGRSSYDRPPYERTGIDRSGPERYSHSSSPYGMLSPKLFTECVFTSRVSPRLVVRTGGRYPLIEVGTAIRCISDQLYSLLIRSLVCACLTVVSCKTVIYWCL